MTTCSSLQDSLSLTSGSGVLTARTSKPPTQIWMTFLRPILGASSAMLVQSMLLRSHHVQPRLKMSRAKTMFLPMLASCFRPPVTRPSVCGLSTPGNASLSTRAMIARSGTCGGGLLATTLCLVALIARPDCGSLITSANSASSPDMTKMWTVSASIPIPPMSSQPVPTRLYGCGLSRQEMRSVCLLDILAT